MDFGIHGPTREEYATPDQKYVWRKTTNLQIGDKIHCVDVDLKITSINIQEDSAKITLENTDGSSKTLNHNISDQLFTLLQ